MVDNEKFLEWVVTNYSDYSGLRWAFLYKSNKEPKDFFSAKYLLDFYSWIWNHFRWIENEDIYITNMGREIKIQEI